MRRKHLYLLLTLGWLFGIWYVSSIPSYSLPSAGDVGSMIAHLVEYFVLTLLVAKTLDEHEQPFHHHSVVPVFLFMALLAGIDELHQLWIPGRTASWIDFSFDVVGIMFGFSLYVIGFGFRAFRS